MSFPSCPSCQALLQLGLSLSVQAQRLDTAFPDRAARPSRCATPAIALAELHADYDRRLSAWQQSVREHLEQHQGATHP